MAVSIRTGRTARDRQEAARARGKPRVLSQEEIEKRTVEILTGDQFGGNLWEKYGHRRIYFDAADIARYGGLDWGTYKTGNISSATLNGEKISNSEAKRILGEFQWFKIWYDLNSGGFSVRPQGYKTEIAYPTSREMYDQFVADAEEAIRP